jgi:hypothetical protein
MKTLSRAITAQILTHCDTYSLLRKQWSKLINSERRHELSAAHHLFYLALLGKDWRKNFTPPTNLRKLENGAFQGWMLFRALHLLHSKFGEAQLLAPFDGIVTPQMLANVRKVLPHPNPYSHTIEQFRAGFFPFEAYAISEVSSNHSNIQD